MKRIIYYVASSLDGYIAGPNEDISKFIPGGKGVEQYLADLQEFQTVIMGRKTYEFGYQYGLVPGQPAYPHMEHHIFSKTLEFNDASPSVHVDELSVDRINAIRSSSKTDVYLCGGGQFAGWMLDHNLIDVLKIKLNPIVLGGGTPLFGDSKTHRIWNLVEEQTYSQGLKFLTYLKN